MARESPLQSGFKSHSHKRRSVRFNGLWRVTQATSAPNRTHSGSQGETGAFRAGGITTLGPFCAVRKPCAAGYQNGKLCRFWALVGCAPEERGEPAGQRCAHARRCSEASRPRRNAQPRCWFLRCIGELHGLPSLCRNSGESFHASGCLTSLACTLLRVADSSNAQSCRS